MYFSYYLHERYVQIFGSFIIWMLFSIGVFCMIMMIMVVMTIDDDYNNDTKNNDNDDTDNNNDFRHGNTQQLTIEIIIACTLKA